VFLGRRRDHTPMLIHDQRPRSSRTDVNAQ